MEVFSKEQHVPERRAIFRGFKKFYAKKEFERLANSNFFIEITEGCKPNEVMEIHSYMEKCKQTQSADHYKKRPEF